MRSGFFDMPIYECRKDDAEDIVDEVGDKFNEKKD